MSRRQRLTLVAAILGSGVATIDGTIVNVACPRSNATSAAASGSAVGRERVPARLGSLILIGGSLGDIYGERRVFAIGVGAFGVLSVAARSRRRSKC